VVFSIADNRVAHRRKLRSDLILQSCHQLNPDERSIRKKAFDGISKFATSRVGVSRRAQPLKHSFTSKIVHERPCLNVETAAQHREILPYGSMVEELSHQRISIRTGLRKTAEPQRQNAGAGLRGPKPDPAFPYGCEPCAEVSSLARCLTITPSSNHLADITNTKIPSEWDVIQEKTLKRMRKLSVLDVWAPDRSRP